MRQMEILVGIGEFRVAKAGVLKTIGLGSCIGLAIYDPTAKAGGLAHVMLPRSPNGTMRTAKYADQAVELMVEALERIGGRRDRMVAKLAGGAQIFKQMTLNSLKIGDRNAEAVREALDQYGIRVVAQDIGGTVGRSVYFYADSGRMLVKYSNGGELWI